MIGVEFTDISIFTDISNKRKWRRSTVYFKNIKWYCYLKYNFMKTRTTILKNKNLIEEILNYVNKVKEKGAHTYFCTCDNFIFDEEYFIDNIDKIFKYEDPYILALSNLKYKQYISSDILFFTDVTQFLKVTRLHLGYTNYNLGVIINLEKRITKSFDKKCSVDDLYELFNSKNVRIRIDLFDKNHIVYSLYSFKCDINVWQFLSKFNDENEFLNYVLNEYLKAKKNYEKLKSIYELIWKPKD